MPHKEAGVLYLTQCPACEDELALGWLPVHDDLPYVRRAERRHLPWRAASEEGVALDPVTCACGQVTLALSTKDEHARAVVTWTGALEPKLRIVPQYGSLRDLA